MLEEYTLLLAQCVNETVSMVLDISPEFAAAARYLGARYTRDVLVKATKLEAQHSLYAYLYSPCADDATRITADAVDRIFGAVVAVADETRRRLAAMKGEPA